MAENKGAIYHLLKAVGWWKAPSENLTSEEAKYSTSPRLDQPSDTSSPNPYGLPSDPQLRFNALMQMARSDLAAPIVELYAEETTQPDINKGKTLWYECNDGAVEKDLNDMLERIHSEDYLFPIAAGVCTTGNNFQRILWSKREGVQQLVGTPANKIQRLWHPTNRRLLGFRWADQKPHNPLYSNAPDVFAPWDFIHFRRIYSSDTEYGQGLLDHLYAIWKKLELSTDQMVLYRLHAMPNRYFLKIDVGNADFTDGMEQVHLWKSFLRNNTGMSQQNPSAVGLQSRFDPAALDSFVILPVRSNEDKTDITTLQGDHDVPDVEDIEHLEKQFLGGARVPKAYLGRGDDGSGLAQASLVSQDIRFARMVRVLRRPIIAGFYRLAQLHLAFKGMDPANYRIKVKMSRISSIEEEVNIATLEKQAQLANDIAALCQSLEIPNAQIVDLVFREYLSVPRYFLDVAKLAMSVNKAMGGEVGGGGGGMSGGGGMMGGMGSGDLDADLNAPPGGLGDMGDGLGDLDAEMPVDAGADPALASVPGRKNNLMETKSSVRRTTRSEAALLHQALSAISNEAGSGLRRLTEAADPDRSRRHGEATALLKETTDELLRLGVGKRVSLVEGYSHGDHISRDRLYENFVKSGDDGEKVASQAEYGEAAPQTMAESTALNEEHPAVSTVKRARAHS